MHRCTKVAIFEIHHAFYELSLADIICKNFSAFVLSILILSEIFKNSLVNGHDVSIYATRTEDFLHVSFLLTDKF